MSFSNIKFHNCERLLSFEALIKEIVLYIQKVPEARYDIVIGTDSKAQDEVDFVSAIGIHRIGNGGRYFWMRSGIQKCKTLQDRIYKETMQSITLAQELKSALKDKLDEEFFWNNQIVVHIDVGENGPTRELKDAVMGMVRGFGLEAVIKPSAYGASVLADRHV